MKRKHKHLKDFCFLRTSPKQSEAPGGKGKGDIRHKNGEGGSKSGVRRKGGEVGDEGEGGEREKEGR